MISVLLLAALLQTPPLEQAQTCRAHMELMIEDAAAAGDHGAGPTWFIRDWWDRQVGAAGAPEDEGEVINLIKTGLTLMRADEPERFGAERQDCVDTAIAAGAVPGMGPA